MSNVPEWDTVFPVVVWASLRTIDSAWIADGFERGRGGVKPDDLSFGWRRFADDDPQPIPVDLLIGSESQCEAPVGEMSQWKRGSPWHPGWIAERSLHHDPISVSIASLKGGGVIGRFGLPSRKHRLGVGVFDPAIHDEPWRLFFAFGGNRAIKLQRDDVFVGESANETSVERWQGSSRTIGAGHRLKNRVAAGRSSR